MNYIPIRCEKFTPDKITGWICCACGHFNSLKKKLCFHCDHQRCEKMIAEIKSRPDARSRPANLEPASELP